MKQKIISLLKKYEDDIMLNTLGATTDQDDERYAEVYKWEWREHKEGIAHALARLIQYGLVVSPTGLAYIIICEWSGVMTFDKDDLNISGLEKVSEKILNELQK